MKNVMILSTSMRKGGNSDTLANAFAEGAKEAGHQVEKINLYEKEIGFCKGCQNCQKTGVCVIRDDMSSILKKMETVDVLVFATPIYFYEMSGQMKTFLDRTFPIYPDKYRFKDVYLLASSASLKEMMMDGAVRGLEGWIACFDHARLAGVVCGTGAIQYGDIKIKEELLKSTFDMGKAI